MSDFLSSSHLFISSLSSSFSSLSSPFSSLSSCSIYSLSSLHTFYFYFEPPLSTLLFYSTLLYSALPYSICIFFVTFSSLAHHIKSIWSYCTLEFNISKERIMDDFNPYGISVLSGHLKALELLGQLTVRAGTAKRYLAVFDPIMIFLMVN